VMVCVSVFLTYQEARVDLSGSMIVLSTPVGSEG